jgi:hypothetical protein
MAPAPSHKEGWRHARQCARVVCAPATSSSPPPCHLVHGPRPDANNACDGMGPRSTLTSRRSAASICSPPRSPMRAGGVTGADTDAGSGWPELTWYSRRNIPAMVVRKTKTDRRAARHLRDLLQDDRHPVVWIPDPLTRDLRARRNRHGPASAAPPVHGRSVGGAKEAALIQGDHVGGGGVAIQSSVAGAASRQAIPGLASGPRSLTRSADPPAAGAPAGWSGPKPSPF